MEGQLRKALGSTENSKLVEEEHFMNQVQVEIEKVEQNQEVIIVVDFKGRTERRENDSTVRRFGQYNVNENGERLIDICEISDLRLTNGLYRHKNIHKYTWVPVHIGLETNTCIP